MAEPADLFTPTAQADPSVEQFDGRIARDVGSLGEGAHAVLHAIDPDYMDGPARWTPVVLDDGVYFPKRGCECLVSKPADGSASVVVQWEPLPGAEPDVAISGGEGGGDKNYEHSQGVAAKEWEIKHGLEKEPCVIAFDTMEHPIGFQQVPVDSNTIILKFNIDISGRAVLN